MKPVVVFRHARTEGAGYFGEYLKQKRIPWTAVRIDLGEPLPTSMDEFSGLVLMGGPMSVNDDLPWIPPVLALIREAMATDIPVLGHCLGGQLISKALGAEVSKNPVKEIGWCQVKVSDNPVARDWFGELEQFRVFQWHGETFALPPGAAQLLSSEYCQNQAYAIGKHLAFQCHIEMLPDMVKTWCATGEAEILEASSSPAVQQVCEIQQDLEARVAALSAVANPIYERWLRGLKH